MPVVSSMDIRACMSETEYKDIPEADLEKICTALDSELFDRIEEFALALMSQLQEDGTMSRRVVLTSKR